MSAPPLPLSGVRRAALRLEMAEGRVQAIRQAATHDSVDLEQAVFNRDGEREAFRLALRDATGCDPSTLARMLAL